MRGAFRTTLPLNRKHGPTTDPSAGCNLEECTILHILSNVALVVENQGRFGILCRGGTGCAMLRPLVVEE